MSNRKYDSSKIRVEPVFSYIDGKREGWPTFLQWLAKKKFPGRFSPAFAKYSELEVFYSGNGGGELAIAPNENLLDFLVFKDEGIATLREDQKERLRVKRKSELSATEKARLELFSEKTREKQRMRAKIGGRFLREFLFEGIDYPDVVIVTNSIVLIIEGKLTETHLTTLTTWLEGRDQMIRHLDSAMACKALKGHPFFERKVFGMYVVGNGIDVDGHLTKGYDESIKMSGRHPHYKMENYTYLGHEEYWRRALPQYVDDENSIKEIAERFLGYVTWNEIGRLFGGIQVPLDTDNRTKITLGDK